MIEEKKTKFKCFTCNNVLTEKELYYYGHSCNACEAKILEAYEKDNPQHRDSNITISSLCLGSTY